MIRKCTVSDAVRKSLPGMRFGAVIVQDSDAKALGPATSALADQVLDQLRSGILDISGATAQFAAFFEKYGHKFPLTGQIAGALGKGFPPVPPTVLSLLVLETATGILMGVQDASAIQGELVLDIAAEGESFEGMRGKQIHCTAGEIVVRDDMGIIASLFQGPDKRTAVQSSSKDLVYYVFDCSPSLGEVHRDALSQVETLLKPAAGSIEVLTA